MKDKDKIIMLVQRELDETTGKDNYSEGWRGALEMVLEMIDEELK